MNKRDFLKYAGLGIGGVGMAWLLDQFKLPGMKPNPYLEENYAPVSEQLFESRLQVVGELPKELNGKQIQKLKQLSVVSLSMETKVLSYEILMKK